jgi:4-amino-4-deoxy-L-arabinose transferase-like glycosyltransferase
VSGASNFMAVETVRVDHGAGVSWSTPSVQVALFATAHAIAWTLAPGLAHLAPPPDTVEVYMWARDGLLVSNKHPNMAGWLLAGAQALTGAYGWSAYLLAQSCTAITMLFVFLLGREVAGERTAMLGAILCCTLGYFTWFTPQYNANVASMPFWAGFVWAVWMARRDATIGRWIIVGLFGAGVVYCKISGGFLLLVAGLYSLYDPRLRNQLRTIGPWIALLVFLGLVAPAALEIQRQNFLVFEHAASKTKGSANAIKFACAQLLMCSVMLLALALSWRQGIGKWVKSTNQPVVSREASIFVYVFAMAPMLLMLLQSLVMWSRLHELWAIPMASFFGLSALIWLGSHGFAMDDLKLRRIVGVVIIVVPLVYAVVKINNWGNAEVASTSWPQQEMSQRFEAVWDAETKAPLQLVAGDALEGGLIALTAKHRPSLLIDMEARRTPWITADRVARDGLLVIWPVTFKAGDEKLRALTSACTTKTLSFPLTARPAAKPLVLHYCIIPPRG